MAKVMLLQADIARLEGIRQFIVQNIAAELSVRLIAEQFQIGESTLHRHFTSYFKVPIYQFILKCRMERAMELIIGHSVSINQVSTMVGYSELSSFTRAFTKYYGKSPKHYFGEPDQESGNVKK
jgi:AraC-like DNA-binding protein